MESRLQAQKSGCGYEGKWKQGVKSIKRETNRPVGDRNDNSSQGVERITGVEEFNPSCGSLRI